MSVNTCPLSLLIRRLTVLHYCRLSTQLTLDILREKLQGITVQVKPGDGSGPEHDAANGEDAAAAAEVGHVLVLEVLEGGGDGVEHAGSYVGSCSVLLCTERIIELKDESKLTE